MFHIDGIYWICSLNVKNVTFFDEIKININLNILYFYINKINSYVENSTISNFHPYHCTNFNL